MAIERFGHWADTPNDEWLRYALSKPHIGTYHVEDPPADFVARCAEIARQVYDEVDHWVYWTSVLGQHMNRDEWSRKFPHNHGYDGMTLVYYAQVPERGGELSVFASGREAVGDRRVLRPKVGDYALIFDHEVHGVAAIQGDVPRVTLIAGAYPYPRGSTKCRCTADWQSVVTA